MIFNIMKTKTKQYKYGDCIPESIKEYNRLVKQGCKPKIVEGWVEVNIDKASDILPDEEALYYYFPDEYKRIFNEGNEYSDYPRLLQHTWLVLNDEYIDITKNQFDEYGGIIKYYKKEEYLK